MSVEDVLKRFQHVYGIRAGSNDTQLNAGKHQVRIESFKFQGRDSSIVVLKMAAIVGPQQGQWAVKKYFLGGDHGEESYGRLLQDLDILQCYPQSPSMVHLKAAFELARGRAANITVATSRGNAAYKNVYINSVLASAPPAVSPAAAKVAEKPPEEEIPIDPEPKKKQRRKVETAPVEIQDEEFEDAGEEFTL